MIPKTSKSKAKIIDAKGLECQLQSLDSDQAILRLAEGQLVYVPANLLEKRVDGDYRLAFDLNRFLQEGVIAFPLSEEQIAVDKRVIENKVNISKLVRTMDVEVNQLLTKEQVQIDHVSINQYVQEPLPIRQEGEVIIIPLVEEVLVVEKRLLLREEIRISKQQTKTNTSQTYSVRREEIQVQREDDHSTS